MKTISTITLLAATASASAAPTVDALLCTRTAPWDHKTSYVSVERAPPTATATYDDTAHTITVCPTDESKSCSSYMRHEYVAPVRVNSDGTLVVRRGEKGMAVDRVKDGTRLYTIANLDHDYDCGSGFWLGDAILGTGDYCKEFDAKPFLADGKTGKLVAAFGDKGFKADPETLYDFANLDGKSWVVTAYNHTANSSRGFVVDVTTGKITATIDGTATGAVIKEGKQSRTLDKLPACSSAGSEKL